MLKKILVTFDGSKTSEAILPEVAKLAGATPSFRPVPHALAVVVFGSVAAQVLRSGVCPVFLVRPQKLS